MPNLFRRCIFNHKNLDLAFFELTFASKENKKKSQRDIIWNKRNIPVYTLTTKVKNPEAES